MNINGINAGMQASHSGKSLGHTKRAENSSPPTTPSPATEPQVTTSSDEPKTKGVVRLLQEGHFKGVADVRLRINFHDELTQLSIQSVQVDFAAQFAEFLQSAQDSFDTFMATTGATEEQVTSATDLFDAFTATANELTNAFLEGGSTDFSGVATELGTAFDALVNDLDALFPPAPAPAVPEETDVLEVEGDEVPINEPEVVLSPLEELRTALSAHLESLLESIQESATNLPEISEPNGNGVAFDKFMEMLEALNAGESDGEASDSGLADIIV